MEEYKAVKETIWKAVQENMKAPEEVVKKAADAITDTVMDAITENYRSITEVQEIVEAVRAGHRVQIAYFDPEEDELDEMVVRPCW